VTASHPAALPAGGALVGAVTGPHAAFNSSGSASQVPPPSPRTADHCHPAPTPQTPPETTGTSQRHAGHPARPCSPCRPGCRGAGAARPTTALLAVLVGLADMPLDVRDDVHLRERLVDQRRATQRRVQLPVPVIAVVELLVRDEDHVDVEPSQRLHEAQHLLVHRLVVRAAPALDHHRRGGVHELVVDVAERVDDDRADVLALIAAQVAEDGVERARVHEPGFPERLGGVPVVLAGEAVRGRAVGGEDEDRAGRARGGDALALPGGRPEARP
jgi:hypothetical protein